jgi:hypothetical protein
VSKYQFRNTKSVPWPTDPILFLEAVELKAFYLRGGKTGAGVAEIFLIFAVKREVEMYLLPILVACEAGRQD